MKLIIKRRDKCSIKKIKQNYGKYFKKTLYIPRKIIRKYDVENSVKDLTNVKLIDKWKICQRNENSFILFILCSKIGRTFLYFGKTI